MFWNVTGGDIEMTTHNYVAMSLVELSGMRVRVPPFAGHTWETNNLINDVNLAADLPHLQALLERVTAVPAQPR